MAEDVMESAIPKAGLQENECITKDLKIHGYKEAVDFESPLYYYGSDKEKIQSLIENDSTLSALIHPALPYIRAEIVWAVQNEMCMTVEDALCRRTRSLLLDAKSAMEAAPLVANIMAKEMNKDEDWIKNQIDIFIRLAKNYLPTTNPKLQTLN